MDMKMGEEGRVVIHSQVKTRWSLYKDEEALLHTAEVFHHFQCRPVVWIHLLVSNAPNHKGSWVKTESGKHKTKQCKLDPSSICD